MTPEEAMKLYCKYTVTPDGTVTVNPYYAPTPEMAENDRKEWAEIKDRQKEREAHKRALEIAEASAPRVTHIHKPGLLGWLFG